jgi:xylan 1,4-beta-xylosidase
MEKMGSPQNPNTDEIEHLKNAGELQLLSSPAWLKFKDGQTTIELTLPRQGISFLNLKW